jgi:hypothetical protein
MLAIPAIAASRATVKPDKSAKASAARKVWPEETLSGKITTIAGYRRMLVVQSPDGVPFDVLITPRTRI